MLERSSRRLRRIWPTSRKLSNHTGLRTRGHNPLTRYVGSNITITERPMLVSHPRFTPTAWLVMGVSVGLVIPAQASRRTALSNNPLIEDREDIFVFPETAVNYTDAVTFDFGARDNEGDAAVVFDLGGFALGLAIHRSDVPTALLSTQEEVEGPRLAGAKNPIGVFEAPSSMMDLFFASGNNDSSFGGRVAVGTGGESTKPDGEKESGNRQTYLMAQGGFRNKTETLEYDMSASVFYDSANQTIAGEDALSGSRFGATATGRGYLSMNDKLRLGIYGTLSTDQAEVRQEMAPKDAFSDSIFLLMVGMGPVYRHANGTTIAAYASLGYTSRTLDLSDQTKDDELSANAVLLPGVILAADMRLSDWLYFRAGMTYTLALVSADDGPVENDRRQGHFLWNAGIGIVHGRFILDGAFRHEFLAEGPDFIGGESPLFASVSATYTFD